MSLALTLLLIALLVIIGVGARYKLRPIRWLIEAIVVILVFFLVCGWASAIMGHGSVWNLVAGGVAAFFAYELVSKWLRKSMPTRKTAWEADKKDTN